MKYLRRLRAYYRYLRAARKLKRSGCRSWAHYRHCNDSDVCRWANNINTYYYGYKRIHAFNDYSHNIYKEEYDYGPGGVRYRYDTMREWCEQNLRFKWRMDYHRVIPEQRLVRIDASYQHVKMEDSEHDYVFNDLGGGDIVFVAFKDDRDYSHFMLKWA